MESCKRRAQPPSVDTCASAELFLRILPRVAENGFAEALVNCTDLCRDTRTNAGLWERVVDLTFAPRGGGARLTRLAHWASVGDAARVREVLDRGADINACDMSESTALHWASFRGHVAVVRELLSRGAAVDARPPGGRTPLRAAAFAGHTAVVAALAAHGADVNSRTDDGVTPLLRVCEVGHAATAAELLRRGADVNARSAAGRAPLMEAAHRGHAATVATLLAAPGIDVNVVDATGFTPLIYACAHGHAGNAAELLRLGAAVNARSVNGTSALGMAARDSRFDTLRVLLAAPGVDVAADRLLGITRSSECIALLATAGARR